MLACAMQGGLDTQTRCSCSMRGFRRPTASLSQRLDGTRTLMRRDTSAKAARESWDVGRFARTVAFFNAPSSGNVVSSAIETLMRPFRAKVASAVETVVGNPADLRPAICIVGAEMGLGEDTAAALLSQGLRVRVLEAPGVSGMRRVIERAEMKPSSTFEYVSWESQVSARPGVLKGAQALVLVSGGEGGNGQRLSKLLQQYSGQVGRLDGVKLLDAEGTGPAGPAGWGALDDVVMGGVSESGLYKMPGGGPSGETVLTFRGTVSESNSGGFASVRSRNYTPPLDLSGYEGLRIRVRGDGKRYKLTLRCSSGWDTVGYTAGLDTPSDEWRTVDVPFQDFKPVFRAKLQNNAKPFDASSVYSLQIMLSKFEMDGMLNPTFSAGAFQLPIQFVSTYLPEPCLPRLVCMTQESRTMSLERDAMAKQLHESGVPTAFINVRTDGEVGARTVSKDQLADLVTYSLGNVEAVDKVADVRLARTGEMAGKVSDWKDVFRKQAY